MGSSPLETSDTALSVAPTSAGAGARRPGGAPNWVYGLAAAVLILPALIWAAWAAALSALVEW